MRRNKLFFSSSRDLSATNQSSRINFGFDTNQSLESVGLEFEVSHFPIGKKLTSRSIEPNVFLSDYERQLIFRNNFSPIDSSFQQQLEDEHFNQRQIFSNKKNSEYTKSLSAVYKTLTSKSIPDDETTAFITANNYTRSLQSNQSIVVSNSATSTSFSLSNLDFHEKNDSINNVSSSSNRRNPRHRKSKKSWKLILAVIISIVGFFSLGTLIYTSKSIFKIYKTSTS